MEKFLETEAGISNLFFKLNEKALQQSFFKNNPEIGKITLDLMFESFKSGYAQAVFTASRREDELTGFLGDE